MISFTALLSAHLVKFFWDKIKPYWKTIGIWIIKHAVLIAKESQVYGVIASIKKVGKGVFQEISQYFSKNLNEAWEEITVTRKVSENDIPENIKKRAKQHNTVDITEKVERELELY